MALPLKDCEAPVPNNRPQAEQRGLWRKRKLKRNIDHHGPVQRLQRLHGRHY